MKRRDPPRVPLSHVTPELIRSRHLSPFIIETHGEGSQKDKTHFEWSLLNLEALLKGPQNASTQHELRCFEEKENGAILYLESVAMTFAEYANQLRSGEARRSRLYWAMYFIFDLMPTCTSVQFLLLASRYKMAPREVKQLKQASTWLARLDKVLRLDQLVDKPVSSSGDQNDNGERGFGNCLWIGPPDHVETMHYDDSDNLHAQLKGSKRWVLIPPSLCRKIFPSIFPLIKSIVKSQDIQTKNGVAIDCATCTLSERDVIELAQRTEGAYVVDLRPGEALFLPAGWGHQVKTIANSSKVGGFVVSYNRFLKTPSYFRLLLGCLFAPASFLVLKLRFYTWFSDFFPNLLTRVGIAVAEYSDDPAQVKFKQAAAVAVAFFLLVFPAAALFALLLFCWSAVAALF